MKASYLAKLEKRKSEENYRILPKIPFDNIDFFSNDYLGISKDFEKFNFTIKNFQGSTGSRLMSGNSISTVEAEEFIASHFNIEAALIFNTGFDANLGLLSSVPQKGDTIIYDELVHASLRDGIRLSFASSYSFLHNDVEDLKKKVTLAKGTVFVVVESIYSMTGDFSPLVEIAQICDEKEICLIVDEAHSVGVFGERGRGVVADLAIADKIFARIITFSKAFGFFGAAVLGSKQLIDFLVNFSRPFIFATALPIAFYQQIVEILKIDISKNQNTLKANLLYFKQKMGIETEETYLSPIQIVNFTNPKELNQKVEKLKANSIFQKAILPPTVPNGAECLRLCFHSFNTKDEVDLLVSILNNNFF